MANTMFGALSGVRPVNWGLLIQELVARALPYIGRKPSYLSPFILHLYQHYGCTTREEDDLLTIAIEEVNYKLQPVAPNTESDHAIPEAPPSSPGSPPPISRMPNSPPPPSPHHRHQSPDAARPNQPHVEAPWQNVNFLVVVVSCIHSPLLDFAFVDVTVL